MRALALEGEHRVDHVLDHARAGDLPVLGDVPDQDQRRARALGEADQRRGGAAHLRHRAGRGFDRVGPHGLDRVDDHQARCVAVGEGGDNVLDRGLGGELDLRIRKLEPLGAQPHLRHRLLARYVDRAMARARELGRDLEQQRRFADARIAAEQQHRSAHQAAAGDTVELGDAASEPRRVMGLARERLERELAALARRAPGLRGPRRSGGFFRDGVPLAAGVALALPAAIDGAAVLADEGELATGHEILLCRLG